MPNFRVEPPAREGNEKILELLANAFGGSYNPVDTRAALSSPRFNPDDCFIAEAGGSVIGSIAVTSVPREHWFVIRYLATTAENGKELAKTLLKRALEQARAKGAVSIRATTPAVEPYVEAYREA